MRDNLCRNVDDKAGCSPRCHGPYVLLDFVNIYLLIYLPTKHGYGWAQIQRSQLLNASVASGCAKCSCKLLHGTAATSSTAKLTAMC